MVNAILAKRVNHIVTKGDNPAWPKGSKSRGFSMKLHFDWFVILKRENERMYAPFKYAVNAYCLDNIQTFDRRYVTLEDALLHCLNGFNENANIPNRYKSIGHYLSGKS